ncbi:hypothetical protein [Nonomuraea sp. NPDC050643]|uniref:hypothetical protein n=1 Tax=Nonomuraea sp. NPDC050643 TaxID=3155660 RepID=UPI0033DB5B4B
MRLDSLGLACVTLLGTQLAPEDLIGLPEREHAFLIPQGASLPFRPGGPVFHLK